MMKSYILLQNDFYPQSAFVLIENFKNLCHKLEIPIAKTQKIPCENRLLPFVNEVGYYGRILRALIEAGGENKKLLACDSQTLLGILGFFKKYYEDLEFKERLLEDFGREVDILELEKNFVFAPEVILKNSKGLQKKRRWEGFKCGFLVDRELEQIIKEYYLIEEFENLLGFKMQVFYKDSYDYLLFSNKNLAYKMGGKDYYEIIDCGVDLIVTPNIGNFELLDRNADKIKKALGRDDLEIPILFLPQVFLALFEECSASSLLFNRHNIAPKML